MARYMNGKMTNCPNCGAPIEHYYNYQCKYCKTFLYNTDEEIKKINNVNIKVKRVEIERSPINNNIWITIYGVSWPKANWYEEGIGEIIVSGDNVSLGNPIAYRIQIPMNLFYEYEYDGNFEKILDIVDNSLPPVFKEEKYFIFNEIMQNLHSLTNKNRLNI